MSQIKKLNESLYLIDDYDLGKPNRTGTYCILDEKITLIETCTSRSIPYILDGLRELNVSLEEIEYIIVTHIHLDHSGGAGLLLQKCPNAKVVVHPLGAKHLVDPTKLIKSAKTVYGNQFEELFSPILPVPLERIIIMEDQDTLTIGPTRKLQFLHTPGHANHHFSIYDNVSRGIFTGDTLGVFYQELLSDSIELYLPSTSPNQFNPSFMLESLAKIQDLPVESVYFGHFGMSENPGEVYRQLSFWLPKFIKAGEDGLRNTTSPSILRQIEAVSKELYQLVSTYLEEKGIPSSHSIYEILQLDFEVCAMGIIDYLQKAKAAGK